MTSSQRNVARMAVALACAMLAGCATTPPPTEQRFFVVRHAEKADDGTGDPPLSRAGETRAASLARHLQDETLIAAYATPFRRTRQTAEAVVSAHHLTIRTYDADVSAQSFTKQVRQDHVRGAVLVVGHSNTVPQLAAALCGCPVAPLGEQAYGDLFRISFDASGRATLVRERF